MLEIQTLVVTPFAQNARLLIDQSSKDCVVLDPGGELERITDVIKEKSLSIQAIFLTHAHIDHGGGVNRLLCYCGETLGQVPPLIAVGEEERQLRASISAQAAMFGLPPGEFENVPDPDLIVGDGDTIDVGSFSAKVLFTPGHSPGHLALYFEEQQFDNGGAVEQAPVLLAGDTLFAGSIGRTDLPGGDYQTLIRSIREKLLVLPDDTRVLSGHGPDTTVANERRTNPFLQSE